jgi:replication factor A3
MTELSSTPRINMQYLDSFTGKVVRITGQVTQVRGESAIIDSEGAVTVLLNRVRISCL